MRGMSAEEGGSVLLVKEVFPVAIVQAYEGPC